MASLGACPTCPFTAETIRIHRVFLGPKHPQCIPANRARFSDLAASAQLLPSSRTAMLPAPEKEKSSRFRSLRGASKGQDLPLNQFHKSPLTAGEVQRAKPSCHCWKVRKIFFWAMENSCISASPPAGSVKGLTMAGPRIRITS